MRLQFVLPLLGALAGAPIQCPSRRTPDTARVETPGDALWQLAERFRAEGNAPGRERTLRFLVERYPSSRFAPAARDELTPRGESQP